MHSLARNLSLIKPDTLCAGVDLERKENQVVVINGRAQRLGQFRFSHDEAGYSRLHERLSKLVQRHGASGVVVGMEPTNYYWKLLAADLERRQIPYRLVNAYTVRKHREGDQIDRAKDDLRDAEVIANLLREGKFTQSQLLHGPHAALRQYAVSLTRLEGDMRRRRTIIHHSAVQLFPELGRVFRKFSGVTALALLRRHAAACVMREMPLTAFLASVRQQHGPRRLATAKLCQAHALAATSIGLQEGVEALQLDLAVQVELLEQLEVRREQLEQALLGTFRTLPEAPCLLSVPRLGARSAALILAEIGDPGAFSNAQQLVKLAGVQPTPDTSGQRRSGQTPMSHKGRPRLRTVLYLSCLRMIQKGGIFAQEYAHLCVRTPHPLEKMAAIGVLMNKLLRILWALMHQRTLYRGDMPISERL